MKERFDVCMFYVLFFCLFLAIGISTAIYRKSLEACITAAQKVQNKESLLQDDLQIVNNSVTSYSYSNDLYITFQHYKNYYERRDDVVQIVKTCRKISCFVTGGSKEDVWSTALPGICDSCVETVEEFK